MVQGENAVVDYEASQHDDADQIDEIELEAADGCQTEPPEDGGGARREDKKKPQRRANGREEAEQKDGNDDDNGFAQFRSDVLRDGELEGVCG